MGLIYDLYHVRVAVVSPGVVYTEKEAEEGRIFPPHHTGKPLEQNAIHAIVYKPT